MHKNGVDKYVYTYITADENRLYLLDNINNIIAITNDGIDCMVIKIQTSLIKKYWNTENGELCLFKAVLNVGNYIVCLLYTSDAADEEDSVDLGGCRIIKKKKNNTKKKKHKIKKKKTK